MVDRATRTIGEALRDEAAAAGADAVLIVMDERATDGTEPPPAGRGGAGGVRRVHRADQPSLSHTSARKRATDSGARGATMPGVTEDMLARVMAVDFDTMAARSQAVAALLDAATRARVTCPRGTDFELALDGRRGDLRRRRARARRARSGTFPAARGSSRRRAARARSSRRASRRSGSAEDPATLTVAEGTDRRRRRRARSRVHRAAARPRRARDEPRRARGRHERPGAADRQRARGREDPRHRARRVRRERRDRRDGVGADPPRRRGRSTRASRSTGTPVLERGRYVLDQRRPNDAARRSRTSPRGATRRRSTRSPTRSTRRLLDVHSDPDHHRSVFTLAGEPGELAQAVAERRAREAVSASTSPAPRASTPASARSTSRRSSTSTPPTAVPPAPRRSCSATCSATSSGCPCSCTASSRTDGRGPSCAAAARRRWRSGSTPASCKPGLRPAAAPPDCRRGARRGAAAARRLQRRARAAGDARRRARRSPRASARAAPKGSRRSARSGCGSRRATSPRSRPTSRTTARPRLRDVVAAIARQRHAESRPSWSGSRPRAALRGFPDELPVREPPRPIEDALERVAQPCLRLLSCSHHGPDQAQAPHEAPRDGRRDDPDAGSDRSSAVSRREEEDSPGWSARERRLNTPPTWRASITRASLAAVLMFVFLAARRAEEPPDRERGDLRAVRAR